MTGLFGFCNLLTRAKQFRLLLKRAEACGEGSKSKRERDAGALSEAAAALALVAKALDTGHN